MKKIIKTLLCFILPIMLLVPGLALSQTVETYGDDSSGFTGPTRDRGNIFYVTTATELQEIEYYLTTGASTEIYFFVYEGSSLTGTYNRIYLSPQLTTGTGSNFNSSGTISVTLTAGNYYYIGASWNGNATYYRASTNNTPFSTGFGTLETGIPGTLAGYPPATSFSQSYTSGAYAAYYMRVTYATGNIAPAATTQAATEVLDISATLNGVVNANGSDAAVTFEFGTNTSYGSTVTADQSPVTGTTDTAVSAAITGLTPNNTYHFRVVAQNSGGTTNGADMTFTTEADSDGDGVFDSIEGTGDRDGDGIPDNEDYDPTGYFYDELTGEIIPGGQVSVSGPGSVTLIEDGSNGYYQFTTDGTAGIYAITVTLPPGYVWGLNCSDLGTLDPTGQPNPYVLGNGEDGSTGFLTSSACTDFYLQFDLEPGDPFIFNNNLPVRSTAAIPTLSEWGMIIFAMLLAGFAVLYMRKQSYSGRMT